MVVSFFISGWVTYLTSVTNRWGVMLSDKVRNLWLLGSKSGSHGSLIQKGLMNVSFCMSGYAAYVTCLLDILSRAYMFYPLSNFHRLLVLPVFYNRYIPLLFITKSKSNSTFTKSGNCIVLPFKRTLITGATHL